MSSAKELFYPKDKQSSRAEERAFAREELIYNVTEDILVAMESREINHRELARRLGKSRSFVSQVLNGARNMTLGSLSDICFALGTRPRVLINGDEHRGPSVSDSGVAWTESARTMKVRSGEWLTAANKDVHRVVLDRDEPPQWVVESRRGIARNGSAGDSKAPAENPDGQSPEQCPPRS